MKKTVLACCVFIATQALSAEVVLEKNGVTLTDAEVLAAASDLSEGELQAMRNNQAMLKNFIEQQFDNKVMQVAIAEELNSDANYPVLRDMTLAKFTNEYYVKKKTLEKIAAVKDFKTLAKQTYHSNIKSYQGPQTADYYHILFIKQDNVDNKEKADALLADIKSGKITLAEAAKSHHSSVDGTDENGVLVKVQDTQLMEPIQKAIFGMQPGGVSEVVETGAGYHIIGLKQLNEIETRLYDVEVEQQIIAETKNKMYRATNAEIRDKYRGPEGLTINNELLKSVSEKILFPQKP